MPYSNICSWKFKDRSCGYVGEETLCYRIYSSCLKKENFGGFVPIEDPPPLGAIFPLLQEEYVLTKKQAEYLQTLKEQMKEEGGFLIPKALTEEEVELLSSDNNQQQQQIAERMRMNSSSYFGTGNVMNNNSRWGGVQNYWLDNSSTPVFIESESKGVAKKTKEIEVVPLKIKRKFNLEEE
jgi:hypothetical protein